MLQKFNYFNFFFTKNVKIHTGEMNLMSPKKGYLEDCASSSQDFSSILGL